MLPSSDESTSGGGKIIAASTQNLNTLRITACWRNESAADCRVYVSSVRRQSSMHGHACQKTASDAMKMMGKEQPPMQSVSHNWFDDSPNCLCWTDRKTAKRYSNEDRYMLHPMRIW